MSLNRALQHHLKTWLAFFVLQLGTKLIFTHLHDPLFTILCYDQDNGWFCLDWRGVFPQSNLDKWSWRGH